MIAEVTGKVVSCKLGKESQKYGITLLQEVDRDGNQDVVKVFGLTAPQKIGGEVKLKVRIYEDSVNAI